MSGRSVILPCDINHSILGSLFQWRVHYTTRARGDTFYIISKGKVKVTKESSKD